MDEPQNKQQDMTVGKAVETLLMDLPQPILDFVTGPQRAEVALRLSQKYSLHADQAGEFERSFIHMLLGVASPDQFVDTLRKAGVSEEAVMGLARDVNEEVFKPLRKQEEETQAIAAPPAPTPQPVVVPPVPKVEEPVLERGRTMQSDVEHLQQVTYAPQPQAWQPYPQPYAPPPQYVPFPQAYMPVPMPPPQTYWVPVSVAQVPPQMPYQQQPPQPVVIPAPHAAAPAPEPTFVPPTPKPEPTPPPVSTWSAPIDLPTPPPIPPPPQVTVSEETHERFGTDPYREPI